MRFYVLFGTFLGLVWSGLAVGQVRLSEFVAAGAALTDEDGEAGDWIELHNTGATSADLTGYRLTDDAAEPEKWVFPPRTLAPGGRLLVFASGKDRRDAGELHANFSLRGGGEYLALFDATGAVLTEFSPEYPTQVEGKSYGLTEGSQNASFFSRPTPGAINGTPDQPQVADTKFSVSRGIYEDPFALEITTATAGAVIRYTTDGSAPTATRGRVYRGPIAISGTTVIRAAAFLGGSIPTNVDTHSYLFLSDIAGQQRNGAAPNGWPTGAINGQVYDYGMDPDIVDGLATNELKEALAAIPSAMMTIAQSDFSSEDAGIYSNPRNRGREWERPGHLEIFYPETPDRNVAVRCGLRVRGGASRTPSNPKHAFRVFFREEYGDSVLRAPLFEADGVEEFEKIDFRTAQNYSWSLRGNRRENTFLREVLGRDLQAKMGQPHTRSRYHHLYINGIYWGLFMTQERAEAEHGSRYLGGKSSDFDTLKSAGSSSGYITEATDGTLDGDWRRLWDLTQQLAAGTNPNAYNEIRGLGANGQRDTSLPVLLDVDNLIDWMLIIGYTGNYDSGLSDFVSASNNWYAVRNRETDDRGFSFFVHDGEHTLGAGNKWDGANDRINTNNGADRRQLFNRSNPQFIHFELADHVPEYRERFANRAQELLFNGGLLAPESVLALMEKRRLVVEKVIVAESARWGDAKTNPPADKSDWEGAVADLQSVVMGRRADFVSHLRQGQLLPAIAAPTFSPFGGTLATGADFSVAASEGTVFVTQDGRDPRGDNGEPVTGAFSFSGSGGSTTNEFVSRRATWRYLDSAEAGEGWQNIEFSDTSWSQGLAILGHGTLGNTGSVLPVATTIGLASGGGEKPITSYLRKEFTVGAGLQLDGVAGEVLADDGVVVYINGTEVFRKNLPSGTITSSTEALRAIGGNAEVEYQSFSVPSSLLRPGVNVVAAELHQVSSDSSDLGFDLELSGQTSRSEKVTLAGPGFVRARSRAADGTWSPLVEAYFSPGAQPEAGDLIVSEIHFHPHAATDGESPTASRSDFEFLELRNVSDKMLELRGLQLVRQVVGDHLEGVVFSLEDGTVVDPGGEVLVVASRAAFAERYGALPAGVVLGEFSGSLSNGGEWLQVQNAAGTVLTSFAYDDMAPWPAKADGLGLSLERSGLAEAGSASSWRASMAVGGSPRGLLPAVGFGPWATAFLPEGAQAGTEDADQDGVSNLVEFALGSSPTNSTEKPEALAITRAASGEMELRYTVRRGVTGVTVRLVGSQGLTAWDENDVVMPGSPIRTENGMLEEVRQPVSSESLTKGFFRLEVQ